MTTKFNPLASRRVITAAILLALPLAVQTWRTQLHTRATNTHSSKASGADTRAMLERLPLAFEPNRGQTDPQVKWVTHGSGYTVFLTNQDAVVRLNGTSSGKVSRIKFAGANASKVEGLETQKGYSNYYGGAGHVYEKVPNYAAVRYSQVYPGVDTVFRGNGTNFRFDYVVKAGADPNAIAIGYDGFDKVQITPKGELALTADNRTIMQQKPYIYQDVHGKRVQVAGGYRSMANGNIGFELGNYDKQRELVIDPSLTAGTYLGGTGQDVITGVDDDAHNFYAVGYSTSLVFPTGENTQNPGGANAPAIGFALIMAKDGSGTPNTSVIRTWIGSNTATYIRGVTEGSYAMLGTGHPTDSVIYVVGDEIGPDSNNFGLFGFDNGSKPTNSGTTTAFVAAIDTGTGGVGSAGQLDYGTYIGISGGSDTVTYGNAITGDGGVNVWIGGSTTADAGNTSGGGGGLDNGVGGGMQSQYKGGTTDGFVQYLNVSLRNNSNTPTNSSLNLGQSTYLGGNAADAVNALEFDNLANPAEVIAVGSTTSTASGGFPSTATTYQPENANVNSGSVGQNAFIVAISANVGHANLTGNPIAGSFYGGLGTTAGNGVALDTNGNIYITGQTNSATLVATPGSYDTTLSGTSDAYAAKFTSNLHTLTYGTYLGGSGDDSGNAIAVDGLFQVYVVGQTASSNFPTVVANLNGVQPLQASPLTGSSAPFVARFDPLGMLLNYAGVDGQAPPMPAAANFEAGTTTGNAGAAATVSGSQGIVLSSSQLVAGINAGIQNTPFNTNALFQNTAFIGGTTFGGITTFGTPFEGSYQGGTSDGFMTALNFTDFSFTNASTTVAATATLAATVTNGAVGVNVPSYTVSFTGNNTQTLNVGAITYACSNSPAGFTGSCSTPWLAVPTVTAAGPSWTVSDSLLNAANNLQAGVYTATYVVTSDVDNNSETVIVTLTVSQTLTDATNPVNRTYQKYNPTANVSGTNTGTANVDSFTIGVGGGPNEAYTASVALDSASPSCNTQGNWITSVTPTSPTTGNTNSTSLTITYNPTVLESMDLTSVEGSPAAPACTAHVTLSAPNNNDIASVTVPVVMNFTSRIIPSCSSGTATCVVGGPGSEMAYQTSPPTVPIVTDPLVFNFNSPNSAAQSQIISLQADSLAVPVGNAVVVNTETGCSIAVSASPVLGGAPPYTVPDRTTSPNNIFSFSVTANPIGCANNTQFAGQSTVSFVPTGTARSATTIIPITLNVGNVITTSASGSNQFVGPTTGGTVADTPTGYQVTNPGSSINTDLAVDPPTTGYTVAVGNLNTANSYSFNLQVDTLTGSPNNGTCNTYPGSGNNTQTASAGVGVASGWLTVTPSLSVASSAANSILSFSITNGTWAALPSTLQGCTFTGQVTVFANGSPLDAAGSPSTTYNVSFTKYSQDTTSGFSPALTTANSNTNLAAGIMLFQGAVGSGIQAPETFGVSTNDGGNIIDASTNAIANTGYPGYNYPDRSCTAGNTSTSDAFTFVAGACPQSWLALTTTNNGTSASVTANTANLTPSPTQAPINGACPAGTLLITTLVPNVCATPYTGTIRIRSGTTAGNSLSGQNVVEIPVDFVVTQAPALVLSSSSPAGSSTNVTFANFTALSNLAPQSATIAPQTLTFSSSSTTNLAYTAALGTQSFAAGCNGGTLFTLTAAPGGTQVTNTSVSGTATGTPQNVGISANTACAATLGAGTYSTSLAVSSPTASVQNQNLTVSLTVLGAPAISSVPTSFTPYVWTVGSPIPSNTQSLTISSGGTAFTSAFVPDNGGNWITLTNSTTTPTIALNNAVVTNLTPGTYTGNVVITDPNATNSGYSVPVSLTVNAQSVISPTPTSANFTWQIGTSNPASQAVLLTVSGQAIPLTIAVSQTSTNNSVNWLTSSNVQLSTSANTNAATVTIGPLTPSGITTPGTYTGTVTVSSPNVGSVVIPVNLTVTNMAVISVNGAASASQSAAYTLGNNTQTTPICAAPYSVTGNSNGLIVTPVVATTNGGSSWIAPITQTGGSTPTQITVCVTPSALTSLVAGTYTGTVTMTSPNATSAVVNVSLVIEPQPVLTSTSVNYTGVWANPAPATQAPVAINIASTPTTAATNLTISGSTGMCSWVNTSLSSTTTPANLVTTINNTNYLNLTPGSYTCTVTVSGNAGNPSAPAVAATIPITLTINPLTGFGGAVNGGAGTLFLQFPNANTFGYFGYLSDNWMFHADLGYEYFTAANDSSNGFYMYDLKSGHWWYSNPSTFPYVYDFTIGAWLYYFPNRNVAGHYTTNPRYFANLTTNAIFTM